VLLACIDIGSNTTRLLVGEGSRGELRPLVNERAYTRIGKSVSADGGIPREKIEETARVVAAQAARARQLGAERILAVATAAIREAPNRAELAAAVEEAGAEPLWVLSPDEEARLSFLGATRTLPEPPAGTVAVTDVGGGSTELAIGAPDTGVSWSRSWRIGSGSLTESHVRSDPPAAAEIAAMRAQVDRVLGDMSPPEASSAVAVGGTATSTYRLVGPGLSSESLERALEALMSSHADELAARFELDPERVRLLPAGILLLEELSERLALPLEIARGGLREGVLLELLDGPEAGA
jgi:exopolyphosphatase / guanosine-5'-triphosphate,3'-diphosphate pyrophosphatase